jgi:hypothetical protein
MGRISDATDRRTSDAAKRARLREERARARAAQRAAQLRAAAQQRNEPRETRKRTPGHADPLARHLGSYGTPRERSGAIFRLLHQLQEHEDRMAAVARRQAMYETPGGVRGTALAARQRVEPGIGLSQPQRLFHEEEERREASRSAAIAGPDISVPIVARAAGQLAESILYAPAGVYELAKAAGLDVADIAGGDLTPERTAALAKAIGLQIAEDVRHPGRNPGYLFADVLGAAGGVGGAGARLGTGVRAAGQAGRHAGTKTIRRRYDAELGRLETMAEALETTLKRGEGVPEALLMSYADVAKRFVGGTTSRTRAFGRGVARPSLRTRDLLAREKGLFGRQTVKDRKEIEADIRAVLETPPGTKKAGVGTSLRETRAAGRGGGGAKAIETIVREASDGVYAATIYLRPAYIPNNAIGNLFFNIIQQGFMAPLNLAKSFALNKRMGKREADVVDGALGQTAAQAVHGSGPGYVRSFLGPLRDVQSKVADRHFRRAAFLHEARRAGYSKLADVRDLIRRAETNQRAMNELVEIGRKANDEIVRFGRLSATEQHILRHLFFIWSWTKGASLYAARFPVAHPVVAGATAQLGRQGKEHVADVLGDVPDWLRGYIPYGVDEKGNPRLINPGSLTPLGTGLDVARAAIGTGELFAGKELTPEDRTLLDLLNPLIRNPIEARFGGTPVPRGFARDIALVRLLKPELAATKTFTESGTRREAAIRFFAGALYPRPASREQIAEQALKEDPQAREKKMRADYESTVSRARRLLKKAGAGELPVSVARAYEARYRVSTAEREMKEALDQDYLTEAQRVKIRTAVALRVHPELAQYADQYKTAYEQAQAAGEDAVHTYRLWLERVVLGYGPLREFNEYLNQLEKPVLERSREFIKNL